MSCYLPQLGDFDRHATEPPEYLYRLRNPGHWRRCKMWDREPTMNDFGQAIRACKRFPVSRRVFLDAGCGQSPDAACAVKVLGFERAIKIDLFEPYYDGPELWDQKLKKFDGPMVSFIRGDVCDMRGKVEDASVDMIGCNAMIDLITPEDRPLFYAECLRVLRPSGVLAITYIPLKHGYGWDGWKERRTLHDLGFTRKNQGVHNHLVFEKDAK